MKRSIVKYYMVTAAMVFALGAVVPTIAVALPARAEEAQAETEKVQEIEQENRAASNEARPEAENDARARIAEADDRGGKKEVAQAVRQERLTEKKLQACKNREQAIRNIMTRMADRGQKQIDLFTKIADRTELFYDESGNTLRTHGALAAEVLAKKADAKTAVNTTKATIVTFTCDGTDPKGAAASFQTNLKAQNEALKAYKTAVKNLIVGVKSVQEPAAAATETRAGSER